MATSRFENLRAALASAFTTQLASDSVTGVTVRKYRPVTRDREAQVWVGNIRGEQEPYTQGGADGTRAEEMEVDVIVACPTHGSSVEEFETVEQKAEAVMASIETAVRSDITVGSTVFNIEFAAYETNHTLDDQGAWGIVEITLTAEAHL